MNLLPELLTQSDLRFFGCRWGAGWNWDSGMRVIGTGSKQNLWIYLEMGLENVRSCQICSDYYKKRNIAHFWDNSSANFLDKYNAFLIFSVLRWP